jgi:hypothetical protein
MVFRLTVRPSPSHQDALLLKQRLELSFSWSQARHRLLTGLALPWSVFWQSSLAETQACKAVGKPPKILATK